MAANTQKTADFQAWRTKVRSQMLKLQRGGEAPEGSSRRLGAASLSSQPEPRAPRAGRFQLSQKKGAKDLHGSPLQGRRRWESDFSPVNTSSNQTKQKKPNTLQNIIESRVSTRYQYVEDTILMSRHRKKWEYKIHIQGESNQWRLILTWPDIRMRPYENFKAVIRTYQIFKGKHSRKE